ncbi:MAG: hypothetical protein HRU75_12950 [Planctomycetia bacterium]|nr:MAG: hypothetical protein HRU75_12950 [Planctomycetia bacterium]
MHQRPGDDLVPQAQCAVERRLGDVPVGVIDLQRQQHARSAVGLERDAPYRGEPQRGGVGEELLYQGALRTGEFVQQFAIRFSQRHPCEFQPQHGLISLQCTDDARLLLNRPGFEIADGGDQRPAETADQFFLGVLAIILVGAGDLLDELAQSVVVGRGGTLHRRRGLTARKRAEQRKRNEQRKRR